MSDEKLEKEFEMYKEVARTDKKVDVAALMINALQKHEANMLPPKQKRWAYIISFSLPPVGLFFAVKFYIAGKDDSNQAAIICIVLTIASILLFFILFAGLLSGSGTSVDQIKTIKPSDIQQLLQ